MLDDPNDAGGAAVRRFFRPTTVPIDAGPPSTFGDALGRTAPTMLRLSTPAGRLFWIEGQSAWSATVNSGILTPIRLASDPSIAIVVPDPTAPTQVFYGVGGVSGRIFQSSVPFVGDARLCRDGIAGLGGLAVDAKYIYFTQRSDGAVYRIPKSRCM
jgi:hypothetical protein